MTIQESPFGIDPGKPSAAAVRMPSPVYLTGEDFLRVTSFGNVASIVLGVTGRILRPDNVPVPIRETHAPNSNRTVNQTIHPLSEGWLLGLDVLAATGSPSFGQVWVCIELVRGKETSAQVVQALAMGFVTARTPLVWPGGANLLPLDGPGNLRSVTGTTPGAGAEISETIATGSRAELIAFHAQLAASATVANRFPNLLLDDGANVYARSQISGAITASQTVQISWAQGYPAATQQTQFLAPLPNFLRMGAGHRIRTSTTGIQVGDQYSLVQYLLREWLTGE
jgi:hypothetical protein